MAEPPVGETVCGSISVSVGYADALRVKGKTEGKSCIKSVYTALAVSFEGKKEVLGFWIAENEGAKLWMGVLTGLRNRGLQGILTACMGGLAGFPEAVRPVCPDTRAQLCARMARSPAKFAPHKGLKKACAGLKAACSAHT